MLSMSEGELVGGVEGGLKEEEKLALIVSWL